MFVTLDGMLIEVRPEHLLNADCPMLVTPSEMVIEMIFLQLENA